jgi:hypothetical protein
MLTIFAQVYQKKKFHGFTLIWLKARQGRPNIKKKTPHLPPHLQFI